MILWLDYIFHVCIMNDDQTSSNSLTSSFPYRSLLSFPSPAHLNFHPHANLIEFHPARGSSFHTHHSHHTFHDRINHVQPVWRWWGWLFHSPSMYLFPLPSHILHWHSRMSPITSTATPRRPSVGLDFENSIDRYTELDWCDQNCAWNVLIFTSFVGYNVYKSSPNNIIARTQSPPPDWSSIYGRRPSQFNTIRVTRCPSSEGEGWQWNVSNSEQLMCVPCPSTDVPIDWIVQIYFHRAIRNKESFLHSHLSLPPLYGCGGGVNLYVNHRLLWLTWSVGECYCITYYCWPSPPGSMFNGQCEKRAEGVY